MRSGGRIPYRWLIVLPLAWAIVIAPWLLRNLSVLGVALPSGAGRTLFMTSFIDQFTYGRTLDLQHYLDWGLGNILGNIAFQTLANVKTLYSVLDIGLPILALIGLGGMWLRRSEPENRERLLVFVTPVLLVLGLFAFYSFLTPFHTAGGSFKKSYLAFAPFLACAAAWALWTFVQPRRVGYAIAALVMGFALLNGVELTRADFNAAARYDAGVAALADVLRDLGDSNGDGRIIVMTQDPFMLNYHGFYALMLPSDPREMILEAADRYGVDYIILPAAREGLDALYDQRETDLRLPFVGESGNFQILRVLASGDES